MSQLALFSNEPVAAAVIAKAFVPETFTKQLKINQLENKRRIRLSSNILDVMGWKNNIRTSIVSLGLDQGIEITRDVTGKTKIYQRTYKKRKNNPFLETQIDIQNQQLIDSSICRYTKDLHFDISAERIRISPLPNRTFSIRRAIKHAKELEAFVAMSSGIDMHSIKKIGFNISGLLEYRPQEKRDKNDLTETGVLNAMAQNYIANVFNEDISKINWNHVKNKFEKEEPVSLLHISLQCDDFSNVKANKLKQQSIQELDTTIDLVYDALRCVETINPGVVMVENVEGFGNSQAGQILKVKLKKWGYHVSEGFFRADKMGGMTKRKRYYLIASVFPGFQFPIESITSKAAWDIVEAELSNIREVTNNKAVQQGIKTGRIRLLKQSDKFCPTLLKSQNRMAKDSLYIQLNDRIYFPNETILRNLSGFPQDIDLSSVGETIASEIIGQSIDYPMHDQIVKSVYEHIQQNRKNASVIQLSN